MKVDKRSIWNIDIEYSSEVDTFFEKRTSIQLFEAVRAKNLKWTPPIFLYREHRQKDNYVTGELLYAGNGSSSAGHEIFSSREILDLNITHKPSSHHSTQALRGKTLDAFCKLEFCIDTFICIEMGVFNNIVGAENIRSELQYDRDGLFTTTHKKINYLKHRGLLSRESYLLLRRAKDIRNALAHQYLPIDNFGVLTKDLKRYGGHGAAIDHILNGAWFFLLKDYACHQDTLVSWLNQTSAVIPEVTE